MKSREKHLMHSKRPLCLTALAASILTFLQSQVVTTLPAVTDQIWREVSEFGGDTNTEKTIRRRVYDVLNVLLASGIVVREGTSLRYQRSEVPTEEIEREDEISDELIKKEQLLNEKVQMLIAYETLIRRNSNRGRFGSIVKLPTIVVGFGNKTPKHSNSSQDGKVLEILISEKPVLYSPMDVLNRMGLSDESRKEAFRQFPELASLESSLFSAEN
jgi:hypothetical protein